MSTNPIKRTLLEIIDFVRYKVENDKCTMEELRSVCNTLENNLEIDCTTHDLVERYGQTYTNVQTALHRGFIPKAKYRHLYNFTKFAKFIPKTWKRVRQPNATGNNTKANASRATDASATPD